MRTRILLFALSIILVGVLGPAQTFGQEQEEDVRGAFMTTRPKPAEKTNTSGMGNMSGTGATNNTAPRTSRRRPKSTQTKPPTAANAPATTGANTDRPASAKARAQKLGLGLTLFTRDSNGLAVRVDPTRVFRSGDRVRALLETNADGYLYIFNTTDGGKPVMIYPHPELDEGGNYIQSHVPFEIPASVAENERLRWLSFDRYPGAERLFFVFTREPLPGVPTEDELIKYCKENENKCPIQPSTELWAQIQTELSAPLQVARNERYGRTQTSREQEASTRGLGLSKDDPEPSVVMMTASANTAMLVAMLELIHK